MSVSASTPGMFASMVSSSRSRIVAAAWLAGRSARDVGVDLVGVVAGATAGGAQRLFVRWAWRPRLTPGAAATMRAARAGVAGVAADLGDRQPGGERRGLRAGDRRALDEQPGDRLAVFVQQPVGGRRAGDGDDRQQGARRDEVADPDATGPSGSSRHQVRAGCLPADDRLGGARPAAAAAAPAGLAALRAGRRTRPGRAAVAPPRGRPAYPGSARLGAAASRRCRARSGGRRRVAAAVGDDVEGGPEGLEHSGDDLVPACASSTAAMKPARPGVTAQLLSRRC